MSDRFTEDDQVVALRTEGRSFGRIAERLEHSGRFDQAELVRQRQVVDRLRALLLAN